MRIVVYQGLSQNNVLTRMAASLATALVDLGVETSLVPVQRVDRPDKAAGVLAELAPDHVVSFASFGAEFAAEDGRSIYDAAGCGFVGWAVDHPAYHPQRFAAPIARSLQIGAADSHFDYARMLGCRAGQWLTLPGVDTVAGEPLPIEDRPLLATVAMSWLGEPTVWWNQTRGSPVFALIEGVVGRLLEDQGVDLATAFRAAVADTALDIRFDESMNGLLANIALFVRQYDRLRLARAMAALDLPCVVCGTGWRDRLGERKHLTYVDSMDFPALAALYARSRVVLNLNAANGASERAVQAMATGAVVVSDFGFLLQSQFEAHGGLTFFDRCDPASVAGTLASVLTSGEAQTMADKGRALVAEAHLWPHRAAQLLKRLSIVKGAT
jgi:hypothetical protein